MAFSLATGRAPGRPRQTAQVCVFGSAPNSVEQPQNIFDAVPSSTCVSSPMTGSYARQHVLVGHAHRQLRHAARATAFGGGLEGGGDAVAAVVGHAPGAMICSPTGSPSDSPHGTEIAGVPASEAGSVHRSLTYIAIGSSTRSPMLERDERRGRRDEHVGPLERRGEVARDQRAHLLRLPVVGVVVARRQRVGADHDAPLHLGAEAGLAGERHDVLERVRAVVADPQAVAHGVEAGEVGRALARRDQVVGGQRVLEVRAADLDDLGAQPAQRLDRGLEGGQHAGLVTLAAELAHHPDPHAGQAGRRRALARGGDHRRHRRGDRGRVARVVTGDDLVQQRGVEHRAPERAGLVERGGERDQPVARHRRRRSACGRRCR